MSIKIGANDLVAVGNGVDQAITGQPAKFLIRGVKGHTDRITCSIDGPAEPPFDRELTDDGNLEITYNPPLPGEYKVTVLYDNKHVKGSPYQVEVIGDKDPKLEKVSKVDVAGKGIAIGKSCMQNEFWIDGRRANITAGLTVHIKNPKRASSHLRIIDMGDGTMKCEYKPTAPGLYIIDVKVEGVHVPGSPFYVRIT